MPSTGVYTWYNTVLSWNSTTGTVVSLEYEKADKSEYYIKCYSYWDSEWHSYYPETRGV